MANVWTASNNLNRILQNVVLSFGSGVDTDDGAVTEEYGDETTTSSSSSTS